MRLRNKPRLDYEVLHRTGEIVEKSVVEKMDESEVLSEMKMRGDLNHSLEFFEIDELETEDEIQDGIDTVSKLSTDYRHLHIELKSKLKEEYGVKYTGVSDIFAKSTTFLKTAQKKLKAVRKSFSEHERNEMVKVEKEVLDLKISQFRKTVDVELCVNIDELCNYISNLEAFVNEYLELSVKFRCCFGEKYDELFHKSFLAETTELSEDLKVAKLLRQKLGSKSVNEERSPYKTEVSNQKLKAEYLSIEISLRTESLESKFDQNLCDLTDYQILEITQNRNLEVEFNDILGKITDLASLVCEGGGDLRSALDDATYNREALCKKRKLFFENLRAIVAERDVTPDKLKNASSLQINLPKFSGYDCKMDLYTFNSEFKKLVEPIVQKRYWADYLKRNYLSGVALVLVEKENVYVKIWEQLFESFGNARLLLQNKLGELDRIGGLWGLRGDEKIAIALAGLLNAMKDLSTLATEHKIEGQLYEGGGLEKVMTLIGDARHRKFRSKNLVFSSSKKDEWGKLYDFLKQELRLRERIVLDNKTAKLMGLGSDKDEKNKEKPKLATRVHNSVGEGIKCSFCDKDGHIVITTPKGNKIVPYYVCEMFVCMSPSERFERMRSKNLCTTCLFPGAIKGPKHKCYFLKFCCPNSHEKGEKIHVLLCNTHKNDEKNLQVLKEFKERFIINCPQSLPRYSEGISCFSEAVGVCRGPTNNTFRNIVCEPDISDSAIFQLQTIDVEGIKLNMFFDSGCGDLVIKKSAVEKLRSIGRAKQEVPGPIVLNGVGGHKSVSNDGIYSVCLPLYDGRNAILSGLCLPKITAEFPVYDLDIVQTYLVKTCKKVRGVNRAYQLPKLPSKVGGDTDILLGEKYARYFPKLVFECKSGLGIYRSIFKSVCGTRGVVGGPHPEFSKIEQKFKSQKVSATYFTESIMVIRNFWEKCDGVPFLGVKPDPRSYETGFPVCCTYLDESFRGVTNEPCQPECENESDSESCSNLGTLESAAPCVCPNVGIPNISGVPQGNEKCGVPPPVCNHDALDSNDGGFVANEIEMQSGTGDSIVFHGKKPPPYVKQFDEIEKTGTEVTYRCVDCRGCLECKRGARVDAISIQEEIEQAIIERCVRVDIGQAKSTAKLAFVREPEDRLVSDEAGALKVYRGQTRSLSSRPVDRAAVIESEGKLQALGFVDYVENLSELEKGLVLGSKTKYFIPWRVVFNENSLTTPCRLVFDASHASKGGCSLNSLLAKGANSLNKLVEILIRWTSYVHAFHTDVSKMYNRVWLETAHWRYQLYLWSEGLKVDVIPVWKVIKTLIYGVRSSGNLAECALRRTADLCKNECPRAFEVIHFDTYLDDCVSGTEGPEQSRVVMDELQLALSKGGFTIKGFIVSGEDPPAKLCHDDGYVLIGGLKWLPREDSIMLNIKELNFNKKVRGKKSKENVGIVPNMLTKRDCVSKCSEIFDPLGKIAPIIAGMKLDISLLHQVCPNWDDQIPPELLKLWAANFDLMEEIGNIKFSRAVVPLDAVSLDIETIDTADAGENLICAAVYARFKRRDGTYSCQLIFARTKIVHNLSIPRAELEAALLNASTGYIVRLSIKDKHKRGLKLTDSQVCLHWINCTRSGLKMWVRNRVIEITRLTERSDWRYVKSSDNIADLGTRKGAKVSDVGPKSCWIQGYPWMSDCEERFPLTTVSDVILSKKEKNDVEKEQVLFGPACNHSQCIVNRYVPSEVGKRYKFSKYLINPNKFRFRTILRILGIVFLFIQNITRKIREKRPIRCLKTSVYKSQNSVQFIVARTNLAAGFNVVVIQLTEALLNAAKAYLFEKATAEVKHFVDARRYEKLSIMKDGILYYTGRILPVQEIYGGSSLADVCLDLTASSFCVPITDAQSPIAYAIVAETHWYSPDVSHGGVESVLRYSQQTAYIIGGRELVKTMKKECVKCRILAKKGLQIAMGPIGENNLHIAPPFYICQVDICGPFKAYSPANARSTLKIWFCVFCCTVTSAVDCRVMERYHADSFLMAFERFACRFSYPKILLPDEGSQLVNGCEEMVLSMSDIKHKLSKEYGVEFRTCPVGAHYVHGKAERKIQSMKKSLRKRIAETRLSILQWETLGQQIANSINNTPLGLGNKTEMLENLDILTPNRLILGRNNSRNPTAPLQIQHDVRKIIESNNKIFQIWFKEWLISYVPTLVEKPKWFVTERNITVGDVVLFLKSEREFDRQFQYGIVTRTVESRDGIVRTVEVEYQNPNEKTKRSTVRCPRDLVVVHPIDEIGISKELYELANMN